MNYTTKYHLPQWDETDRIMRTDFNQMCADIDSGINTAQTAAEDAKTEALKLPYVVGTYTGTGEETRYITLGFRPRYVIVSGLMEGGAATGADHYFIATSGSAFHVLFSMTDDGFVVRGSSGAYLYPKLNEDNYTYDYIAFR